VPATLKVTQESLMNPAGSMRGTFDVVADGKSAGSVKWHERSRCQSNPDITPRKHAGTRSPCRSLSRSAPPQRC
jgi:hypothetical protein